MENRDKIIEELKHLVGYFQQASHEFFDETSSELVERAGAVYNCLEQDKNSLEDYQKMVQELVRFQQNLKTRVDDLGFLTLRMNELFKKSD